MWTNLRKAYLSTEKKSSTENPLSSIKVLKVQVAGCSLVHVRLWGPSAPGVCQPEDIDSKVCLCGMCAVAALFSGQSLRYERNKSPHRLKTFATISLFIIILNYKYM